MNNINTKLGTISNSSALIQLDSWNSDSCVFFVAQGGPQSSPSVVALT